MTSDNGDGPWGKSSGKNEGRETNGQNSPSGGGQQIPEIDEIVRKGQEQLRVLMGGRGSRKGGSNGKPGGGISRGSIGFVVLGAVALWLFTSLYTVKPEEQSVELFLGEFSSTGNPGLNFAPWPLVSAEVIPVTREQTEDIGLGGRGDSGLMLTTDENIVDIDFQVVWNINDPAKYLFNLAEPRATIRAVSESAMREVIARSELAPILNRDRQVIADTAQKLIQDTMDQYNSGVNIVRLNLDKADPPMEVIDSFREVQAAEQERDKLERQADAYAYTVLAGARGEASQLLEQAEGYRAMVVNGAEGEASRFSAVLAEYKKAPEVTRKRLYLEAMEGIFGSMNKILLDDAGGKGGSNIVPYLPLNELTKKLNDKAEGSN